MARGLQIELLGLFLRPLGFPGRSQCKSKPTAVYAMVVTSTSGSSTSISMKADKPSSEMFKLSTASVSGQLGPEA